MATRKAKDAVDEVLGNNKQQTNTTTHSATATHVQKPDIANIQPGNYQSSVKVNGLPDLTPDSVSNSLPKFDINQHKVTDVFNPPTTLQQTNTDRERCKNIYQQRKNAWETVKDAYNDSGYMFDAIGSQASAIDKGIKAATNVEKAKGSLMDYLKTTEDNKQKYVGLQVNQYKTANAVETAVYTKQELDSKLAETQNKAALATEKAKDAKTKLDEFRKQLGNAKNQ